MENSRKFDDKFLSSDHRPSVTHQRDELRFHLAIITLTAVVSFSGNIRGNFVFDDREAIVNNRAIRDVGRILHSDFWGHPIRSPHSHKSYRPITTITFAWVFFVVIEYDSVSWKLPMNLSRQASVQWQLLRCIYST